jgi:hypothetical protein
MSRTFVGGRMAGVILANVLLTLAVQALTAPAARAQTVRSGPTTTPSGSYLNLQPRRQMPQPPLVAPSPRPTREAWAAERQGRTVVCGMTVLTPPPGTDEAMVKPIAKDGPRPTMRTVDPPTCNPAR